MTGQNICLTAIQSQHRRGFARYLLWLDSLKSFLIFLWQELHDIFYPFTPTDFEDHIAQLDLDSAILICFDMHLPVLPISSPFFLWDTFLSEFHFFCKEEDAWAIHNLPRKDQFCKILWENGYSAKRCIRGKYFPAENKHLVDIEFWAAIDCFRFVWRMAVFQRCFSVPCYGQCPLAI